MNYDKLKAVANLESDIGEVIDGLTELAERFPEDFTSLMDTFHEPQQPRLNQPLFQRSQIRISSYLSTVEMSREVTGYLLQGDKLTH